MLPTTAPVRASEISAEVELTPPTSNGAEVQEYVTRENVVDIQRYLRWADTAMEARSVKKKSRKAQAPPKGSVMEIPYLRIEMADWHLNDYRISDRRLEFRARDCNGQPFPDQRGIWRRLTASELMLHFRFNTVVAHWY